MKLLKVISRKDRAADLFGKRLWVIVVNGADCLI